jgi:Fe-S oxidoreductase
MKILEAKVEAIEKTGAQRVITSNPGCHMQLLYARKRWGTGWNVSHISEILTLALRRSDKRYQPEV